MAGRAERIRQAMERELSPLHLELADESHRHSGPGQETHFNLAVVSAAFEGLRPVQRQRRVYQALAAELGSGLHALTLRTLDPGEWAAAQGSAMAASPACRGGSKGG